MAAAPAVGRVLNTDDAVDVLEAVLPAQNRSYELGLKFKLPPHEVKAIHSPMREQRECLRDVIIRFLEGTEPGPTWRVIIDALRSPLVDLPALASKLEAVHFPDSTSTGVVVTETTETTDQDTAASVTTDATTLPNPDTTGPDTAAIATTDVITLPNPDTSTPTHLRPYPDTAASFTTGEQALSKPDTDPDTAVNVTTDLATLPNTNTDPDTATSIATTLPNPDSNPDTATSITYDITTLPNLSTDDAITPEQAKVKLQVEKFRQRFNGIKRATINCLILCQIAVATMPCWLTEINSLCEHEIFLNENLDVFAKCETYWLLFGKLNFYWNYLAYDLLYQLIEVLTHSYTDFKPIYGDIVAYKKDVEEFRKCTFLKAFCEVQLEPLSGKNDPPPGFKAMVVQFKWAKDVMLEEVERFRRRYAGTYNLEKCAMMVNSIRPGSFTVTWFVAVSTIRRMTGMDVELFAEFNVITLVIDGTCTYVSPVQLPLPSFTPPLSLINDELRQFSGRGGVEAVTSLISAGAYVNDVNQWGESPLMLAAGNGSTEVISLLVKAGAALDLQDKRGDSPLILAARWGRTEVVSLLVEAGAALDLQDQRGESPLMLAMRSGETEVVSLLVKAGAALDLQNMWGEFPLMEAARRGKTEVVSLLMEAGAALDLQNKAINAFMRAVNAFMQAASSLQPPCGVVWDLQYALY